MRMPAIATALALGLAACSGGDSDTDERGTAENSAAMPGAPQAAAEPPEAEETELAAMPEKFRGEWDLSEADCAGSGSDMHLTIEADRVEYYESAAELTQLMQTAPGTVTAEHAFSGEGEQWTETIAYELSEDGERLTVTTPQGDLTIRVRCA
ncbi:hypothetical protein [uncultured Parasphingopyxis sp.]|uniref:hypothetical protein n=1 Tax=uncultured Parasphingopyxis sp. TaxID=1547918 RepID=UPI0026281E71|nr:hypothetical protein [uncultured Parasphingopyxis sp.]